MEPQPPHREAIPVLMPRSDWEALIRAAEDGLGIVDESAPEPWRSPDPVVAGEALKVVKALVRQQSSASA